MTGPLWHRESTPTVSLGRARNAASGFTVNSATSITATAPAGEAGTVVDITVTGSKGTSAITTHDHFTYRPTVTGVSPNSGGVAGGQTVTVTGSGFAVGENATTFKFGTAIASSANCSTSTSCAVVVPAHTAGTVDVIATVAKTASLKNRPGDRFSYS